MTEINTMLGNVSFNKYTQYFKDKEISSFLEEFFDKQTDKIINDLKNLYENGDLKGCNDLIKKINENRIFRIFSKEKKIILLDIIIKNLLPYFIESPSDILSFLGKVRFLIPQNYKMDWKFFYNLYYLLQKKNKVDFSNYIPFLKSLHKFISEDSMSQEEYDKIKRTFMEDLLKSNKSYAIGVYTYFFPKKYISVDENLQYKLFQLFINTKNYFVGSCCMFSKILKKNGKLYFSKNEKENDEYIKTFIKYYFTNLNLYLINDSSIKNDNYSSPTFANNDRNKKKKKFDHSIIDVLINLLFNSNLKEYSELVDNHLKIILNNKHLYINENSNNTIVNNFIQFIKEFVFRLYNLFHGKKFEEQIYKKIRVSPLEYKENEYLYNKLKNVIKYFNICFKKLFLYENNDTLPTLQKLFNFLSSIEISDEYMKQLLNNLDFEEYLKILDFFKENLETKSVKFISKLQTILPLLLSKFIYSNYPKVREFIKDVIILTSSSVSSANIDFDIKILIMFGTYFYDIKNRENRNKIYESLIPLINEATITIMNNIVGFLDLICLRNNSEFNIFISSMKHYLGKEEQKKISKKYADYIEENEIESKYLIYYFNVIDEEEHIQVFNYIFNNMIYVDSSNNTKVNEYFLYPLKDEELKINIPYCSLEIIERQVEKYQNIFPLLNFQKILTNEKNIKRLYQIYFTLINRDENCFKKLGIELFNSLFNSLLNCKIKGDNLITDEKDLIEYPSEENIKLINNFYKKLVQPYEQYIIDQMKDNKKENNTKKIENIMYIYIMLIQSISLTRLNLILMLNQDDSSLKEYKSIQNQLNMYKEYKDLVKKSLEVINQIYEYNKKNEQKLFNNQNIFNTFDNIILNVLTMDSQRMTDKRTKLREKKSYLYKYFSINDIKHFWLKQKITVMNYNYFSLMKNFINKDDFYYTSLYIYSLNLSAVNHSPNIVGICRSFIYPLNKDKIKELYDKIFNEYKNNLFKIKEESETDKNIMQNISKIFFEFSLTYISLFPEDILNLLTKIIIIYGLLKIKKYSNIEKSIGFIIFRIKSLIYLPVCSEKKYKKIKSKYSGRNEIILNECNKLNIGDKIKENNNKYYNVIKQILDIIANGLNGDNATINNFLKFWKIEEQIGSNIINDSEKLLLFFRLNEYILDILDKNDEIYKNIIKIILDNIFSKFVPISLKYFWIKIFHILLKDEYNDNKEYEWIKFNSEEDFNNYWTSFKYEIKGKKKNEILPVPVETIRLSKFIYNEKTKENNKYNIDINKFYEIIKEINEWSEEQALISSGNNKQSSHEFLSKMLGFNKENKGLEFKRIKLLYYMMQLNYIEYDKNDFIKNFNLDEVIKKDENELQKNLTVILELLSSKYFYMLSKNILNDEKKKEIWEIMKYYTNGSNKKVDEKIISFFNFIFCNFSLEKLIFLFKDSNFEEYSIDFVSKLYNLYLQYFIKIGREETIFSKEKTNQLINKIISNESNLILYSNELKNIIKLYFEMNNYLKYDYNSFENKYTKDIMKFFNELLEKDFSKRSRYTFYEIYSFFFYCLNEDLIIFDSIMPKISLCITEFKTHDKIDLGNNILQTIEGKFKNYNKEIDFKNLCEKVDNLLKKEDNSSNNKLLYLKIINIVYNNQKHFNLNKYTSKEIFEDLYKVFNSIKTEDLKMKFSNVFVSYFNDLTEEENKNYIKEYQEKIINTEDNNNYIYILMSQLLRFRMNLPEYIQSLIVSIKNIYKKKDSLKSIINSYLKIAMDNYHGTYIYMKNNISSESKDILEKMTIEKSYFI